MLTMEIDGYSIRWETGGVHNCGMHVLGYPTCLPDSRQSEHFIYLHPDRKKEIYKKALLAIQTGQRANRHTRWGLDEPYKALTLVSDAIGGEYADGRFCIYDMMRVAPEVEGLRYTKAHQGYNDNSGNFITAWVIKSDAWGSDNERYIPYTSEEDY